MKYKAGDKVIVKNLEQLKKECTSITKDGDLVYGNNDFWFRLGMRKHCNKIVTIKEYDKYTNRYKIEDDGPVSWYWIEENFKPLTKAGKILFEEKKDA